MSEYYTPPDTPPLRGDLDSDQIRDQFGELSNAFDLLPPPLGGGVQGFDGGQFNSALINSATILSSALGSNVSPCWATVDFMTFHKNTYPTFGSGNMGLTRDAAGDLQLKDAATIRHVWDSVGNTIPTDPAVGNAAASVAGFFYIPQSPATSAGVPSKIYAGAVPMVWNSNTLKLAVYSGGAWKFSAAFV